MREKRREGDVGRFVQMDKRTCLRAVKVFELNESANESAHVSVDVSFTFN